MRDVAAIVANIAVLDPKARLLLDNSAQVPPPNDNVTVLGGTLADYNGQGPGGLLATWQNTLTRIRVCLGQRSQVFVSTNAIFISPHRPSTPHERLLTLS